VVLFQRQSTDIGAPVTPGHIVGGVEQRACAAQHLPVRAHAQLDGLRHFARFEGQSLLYPIPVSSIEFLPDQKNRKRCNDGRGQHWQGDLPEGLYLLGSR
jgi:hypothetical protein